KVAEMEAEIKRKRWDVALRPDAAIEQKTAAARAEGEPLREQLREAGEPVRAKYNEQIEELEREIQPLRLVLGTTTKDPETRLREMHERYPGVFKSGMGAQALLDILQELDIEQLREKLQQEINSSSGQR